MNQLLLVSLCQYLCDVPDVSYVVVTDHVVVVCVYVKVWRCEGVGSAMNQCENREEGVSPSKITQFGEHDSQTKTQRWDQHLYLSTTHITTPSWLTHHDSHSKLCVLCWRQKKQQADFPVSSCASMKSDHSQGQHVDFKHGQKSAEQK